MEFGLNHGAGHVDRLLAGRRTDATVLGLARPWQVVPGPLPRTPLDVPADRVLVADPSSPEPADPEKTEPDAACAASGSAVGGRFLSRP